MSADSSEMPDPHDFLDLDSLLSEEEILLRDTVRSYVQKEVVPNVGRWWDEGRIPHADRGCTKPAHPRAMASSVGFTIRLDGEELHNWMRKQQIDIDQRPTPHWTPTSISIVGSTLHAEVHREGEDCVAVVETDPVLVEIESHEVPMDHLALVSVPDLTTHTDGPADRHSPPR